MQSRSPVLPLVLTSLLLVGGCTSTLGVNIPAVDNAQRSHRTQQAPEEEKVEHEEVEVQEDVHDQEEQEVAIDTDVTIEAESGEDPELWRWNLEVGKSYRLSFESATDIKLSIGGEMGEMMGGMGGMGMPGMAEMGLEETDRITIQTDLTLHVREELADGRYDLEIPVDRMVLEGAAGRTTVDSLPDEVRVLRATMTPRGEFQFYERVLVEVSDAESGYAIARFSDEDGNITLGADLGVDGASASSRATINTRTGEVTLTQEVRQEERRTRQVEEERPVQYVDLLPADVLSLLELPEGPVAPGDSITTRFDAGTIQLDAGEPQQCDRSTCGNLRIRADIDSANFQRDAMAQAHAEVPGGMPTMKTTMDAVMLFDVPAGRVFHITGNSSSDTDGSGVSIEESTEFTLIFFE